MPIKLPGLSTHSTLKSALLSLESKTVLENPRSVEKHCQDRASSTGISPLSTCADRAACEADSHEEDSWLSGMVAYWKDTTHSSVALDLSSTILIVKNINFL